MARPPKKHTPADVLLYRTEEAMAALNLSRYRLYQEIHAGRLRPVRSGRTTRFTRQELDDFVTRLVHEAEEADR